MTSKFVEGSGLCLYFVMMAWPPSERRLIENCAWLQADLMISSRAYLGKPVSLIALYECGDRLHTCCGC